MSTSPSITASSNESAMRSMSTSSSKYDLSRSANTGLLSPPDSPTEKPRTPYVTGAKFIAKRHVPPTTVEMGYDNYRGGMKMATGKPSRLEWVLSHPPACGVTHAMEERCIEIVEIVRAGDGCGAQVLLTADGFIAKVYDPLYYKFSEVHFGVMARYDVTDFAEQDYITEAAVYSELIDTPYPGTIMPKYYGSWTISLPVSAVEGRAYREVRLILLEHVTGRCMRDIDPTTLTRQERDIIVIKLVDADMKLRISGVSHDDLEPRNVMLSLADSHDKYECDSFRLCIIDFASSSLWFDHDLKGPLPGMRNPLFYWVGQSFWSDWGWLPPEKEAIEWMWEMWGSGGKDGTYVKAEMNPDNFGRPLTPVFDRE